MAKGHTPGFERPDVDKLRQTYKGPSRFSGLGSFVIRVATSRTTVTVLLGLLIFAALFFGYWVIGR